MSRSGTKTRREFPAGALYWFTLQTLWKSFDLVFTNATITPDLEGRHGQCDPELGIIWLDEEMLAAALATGDKQTLIGVVVHESMHAIYATPGEPELLSHIFGRERKRGVIDREELIVTHTAPKLADAFLRSGLFKFPPLPKRK